MFLWVQPACLYVPNYSAAVHQPYLWSCQLPKTWRTEDVHISSEHPGRVKFNTGFIDRKGETLASLPVCWKGHGLSQG